MVCHSTNLKRHYITDEERENIKKDLLFFTGMDFIYENANLKDQEIMIITNIKNEIKSIGTTPYVVKQSGMMREHMIYFQDYLKRELYFYLTK